jgi:hypothetical protein
MKYNISRHAQTEIKRRGMALSLVEDVLQNLQQIVQETNRRKVY